MKKYFLSLLITLLMMNLYAQNHLSDPAKADFNLRMESYINSQLANPNRMAAAKHLYGHTCHKEHIVTTDEIKARVSETERGNFIQANLAEYMRLYFPQNSHRGITSDTLICDNGGFEDDFLYYRGYTGLFTNGSNTCTPYNGLSPTVFSPVTLPTVREFEIVTAGMDAVTGLQKVKFGTKALKLNDLYSHTTDSYPGKCYGHYGIDKLVKRFKVTEENRDFTVWYSLAMENPTGHINTQPYFSIKCDLAPDSDLCFDAAILDCDSTYSQPSCGSALMDVLDWTCHRVKIPASEIGHIATLEITMSDCGESGHNGYAYIDGICEECTGSALGSITLFDSKLKDNKVGIDYVSCNGDLARICGLYTDPFFCGDWYLDSIVVAGYPGIIVSIDTTEKTFCFDFPKEYISGTTHDLYVKGFFKRLGGGSLPVVFSNTILLDKTKYTEKYDYSFSVSNCYDNGTSDNISDDYYFVDITLTGIFSAVSWSLEQQLLDPYDNESGYRVIASGVGSFSTSFGPFLIQEGSWEAILTIGECEYRFIVEPPAYCVCSPFDEMKISNVRCIANDWSFDLFVPNATTGDFTMIGYGLFSFNTIHTINMGPITNCKKIELEFNNNDCKINFTICPPKKCSETCELEVVMLSRTCDANGNYTVDIDVRNTGSSTVCYRTLPGSFGMTSASSGIDTYGPYSVAVEMTFCLCPSGCMMCTSDCCKTIKVFPPDCSSGHFGGNGAPRVVSVADGDEDNPDVVRIVPNPGSGDFITLISSKPVAYVKAYDISGHELQSLIISNGEYQMNVATFPKGTYIFRYHFGDHKAQYIKYIKL